MVGSIEHVVYVLEVRVFIWAARKSVLGKSAMHLWAGVGCSGLHIARFFPQNLKIGIFEF